MCTYYPSQTQKKNNNMAKSLLVLASILICMAMASAKSMKGSERHTIRDFLENQRSKRLAKSTLSTEHTIGDDVFLDEYSPVCKSSQAGLKESDKIVKLPGQPKVGFSQYSGYVTVDSKAGRALFYWLTEAENPKNKPLVLWLNGGPGCSSIGSGAMTELGPFRPNPDGKTLSLNKDAWNTVANVLFLESPAGVGFSYSNTSSDYKTGDTKTASDSYTFLVNWFERFAEYKSRDFYITGESYAGHYIPQLARLILAMNKKSAKRSFINLKGVAIGNAFIDYEDETKGTYDYLWARTLISDKQHRDILKSCDFSPKSPVTENCTLATQKADENLEGVYHYDIYAPLCGSNDTDRTIFDPCTDEYAYNYLNTPEVQKALHANVTGKVKGPWLDCSDPIFYNWKDEPDTVLPVIQKLMASGIRVWFYSGDTDAVVPITATEYSLNKIGGPVKKPWYPWHHQREVGGYVVEYENVTFVTVRGAGHFVPSYQPSRALALLVSFLKGKAPE